MFNVSVPKISKEELKRRYEKIKPIVLVNGEKFFLDGLQESELSDISFLYLVKRGKLRPVELKELKDSIEIKCIHSYAYANQFIPTVEDVLSQIPAELVGTVKGFEILDPYSKKDIKYGYHVSNVLLYF